MAFDGSLKFDTGINTEGFEDGASTINRAAKACAKSAEQAGLRVNEAFNKSTQISALENQIKQTEQKIQEMSASLKSMEGAKVPTGEYQELSSLVEKTQLKLGDLLDRQEKLENQGVSKNSSRWKSLQYDIDETTKKLKIYKTELQETLDTDRAFTAGQDSAGYAKKAEALDNLNNKLYVQKQRLADLISKESAAAQEAERLKAIADSAEVSNQEIVELNQRLQELQARQKELRAAGAGSGYTEYDINAAEMKRATEAIRAYQAEVESMPAPDSTQTVGFAQSVKMAFQSMSAMVMQSGARLALAYGLAQGGAKVLSAGMKAACSAGKTLLGVTVKLADTGLRGLGTMAQKAAGSLVRLGKAMLLGAQKTKSYGRSFGSMIGKMLLFSAVRKIIHGITSAFQEGIQNYAQYSGSLNAVMSSFVSSLSQLKNSIGSAFSPITSIIILILDALIQKLIQVINVIGQFLAALTGKGTFSKAVKTSTDYAKSIGAAGSAAKDAGQDAKKGLASFDQLNQVQDQSTSGSGSGGGADAGSLFEEVSIDSSMKDFADRMKAAIKAGDWAGIGKIIGEAINKGVAKITGYMEWDHVKDKIVPMIDAFTTAFNSAAVTIDWYAIGNMFGAGINTIANTLYLLIKGLNWFRLGTAFGQGLNGLVYKVDWELFGQTIGAFFQAKIALLTGFVTAADWPAVGLAISTALMGLLSEIDWTMLGTLFAEGFNGIFSIIGNFANNFDWTEFGSSLALSLSTFFQTFDWANAGTAISDIVLGMLNALVTFAVETDWYAFGQGVSTGIQAIDWGSIVNGVFAFIGAAFGGFAAFLGGLLADGAAAAKEYFQGKIEECGGNVVAGILKGILDAVVGIGGWIYNNIFEPFIKGFKDAFGIHSPSAKMAEMGKYLWDGFCKGIQEFFSNPGAFIKANITDPFIGKLKSFLGIHSPSAVLAEIGGYTVDGFNEGVEKNQGNTRSVVQNWASGIASWFSNKLGLSGNQSDESQKWAAGIMSGYNSTISQGYTQSQSIMETWADSIRTWFTDGGESKGVNEASWKKFALQIINAFKSQIESGYATTKASMETWSANLRTWFWGDSNTSGTGGLYRAFYEMAKRVNEGFANGILEFSHLTKNAMGKWAQEAVDEAKNGLDIHSPSKEAYSLAEYFVEGFNNGIAAMVNTSQDAILDWVEGVSGAAKGASLQIPLTFDIQNAAGYLPVFASGTVTPPRAGEYAGSNTTESSTLLEKLTGFMDQLKELPEKLTKAVSEGDTRIVLELDSEVVFDKVVEKNQQETGRTGKNPLLV